MLLEAAGFRAACFAISDGAPDCGYLSGLRPAAAYRLGLSGRSGHHEPGHRCGATAGAVKRRPQSARATHAPLCPETRSWDSAADRGRSHRAAPTRPREREAATRTRATDGRQTGAGDRIHRRAARIRPGSHLPRSATGDRDRTGRHGDDHNCGDHRRGHRRTARVATDPALYRRSRLDKPHLAVFNGWLRANGKRVLVWVFGIVGGILVGNGIYGLITVS